MRNIANITFVKAETPETLRTISELAPRIWHYTYDGILSSEQSTYMLKMMYAPEVLERELASGTQFRLILKHGEPVGYISYHETPPEPPETIPNTIKLEKLYLAPELHGRGIGSTALEYLTEIATDAGYRYLILNVNKHNKRAQRAYRNNGFKVWRDVHVPIGGGFKMDDYVMRKTL